MITIRIFYSPQCPAVFPSLSQIEQIAVRYGCNFEKVNLFEYDFLVNQKYYPAEQVLLKQISEGKRVNYFFAATFIEGKEIPGFPIPVSSIEERLCSMLNVEYQRPKELETMLMRDQIKIERTQLSVKLITSEHFDNECELCLNHHPLVSKDYYTPEQLTTGKESKKREFLEKIFASRDFIGFIAYAGNEPVGMVEALPYEVARKIGFVCSGRLNSRVITCLTVRAEFQSCGIGRMLINALVDKMRKDKWSQIQVFGTPGGKSVWEKWQSKSFYKRLGFISTGIRNSKGSELLALINPDYSSGL